MKTQTINTWMPVFSGFYSTIWDADESYFLDEHKLTSDDIELDYDSYRNNVVTAFAGVLQNELKHFVKSIEVEGLRSPKEYNFTNDAVDIEVVVYTNRIKKFMDEHEKEFCQYLERYKSRDGFISYYSHHFMDWKEDTKGFTDLSHPHKGGAILDFICEMLDVTNDSVYSWVIGDIDVEQFITVLNHVKPIDEAEYWELREFAMEFVDKIDYSFGYIRILRKEAEDIANMSGIVTWQEQLCETNPLEVLACANVEEYDSKNIVPIRK